MSVDDVVIRESITPTVTLCHLICLVGGCGDISGNICWICGGSNLICCTCGGRDIIDSISGG